MSKILTALIMTGSVTIASMATPASAYVVRHPVAAAHYAYHGRVAHPYAAYRVARGAAVGAAAIGAAAVGAYYGGYAQPNYGGDTYGYGSYGNGYYAQPHFNTGDTYSYGSYGTGYYAASPGYGFGNAGYYGGHVLGCGIGNRRCW